MIVHTEAVDVYYEWIDCIHEQNDNNNQQSEENQDDNLGLDD